MPTASCVRRRQGLGRTSLTGPRPPLSADQVGKVPAVSVRSLSRKAECHMAPQHIVTEGLAPNPVPTHDRLFSASAGDSTDTKGEPSPHMVLLWVVCNLPASKDDSGPLPTWTNEDDGSFKGGRRQTTAQSPLRDMCNPRASKITPRHMSGSSSLPSVAASVWTCDQIRPARWSHVVKRPPKQRLINAGRC